MSSVVVVDVGTDAAVPRGTSVPAGGFWVFGVVLPGVSVVMGRSGPGASRPGSGRAEVAAGGELAEAAGGAVGAVGAVGGVADRASDGAAGADNAVRDAEGAAEPDASVGANEVVGGAASTVESDAAPAVGAGGIAVFVMGAGGVVAPGDVDGADFEAGSDVTDDVAVVTCAATFGGGVTQVTGGEAFAGAAFSLSPFSAAVSASVSSSRPVTEIKLLNPRPRRDFGFCIFAIVRDSLLAPFRFAFHVERPLRACKDSVLDART
jgi:hypothetical protein